MTKLNNFLLLSLIRLCRNWVLPDNNALLKEIIQYAILSYSRCIFQVGFILIIDIDHLKADNKEHQLSQPCT